MDEAPEEVIIEHIDESDMNTLSELSQSDEEKMPFSSRFPNPKQHGYPIGANQLRLFIHIEGTSPFLLVVPSDQTLDQYADAAQIAYAEMYRHSQPFILRLARAVTFSDGSLLLQLKRQHAKDKPMDKHSNMGRDVYAEPIESPKNTIRSVPSPVMGERLTSHPFPVLTNINRLLMALTDPHESTPHLRASFLLSMKDWIKPEQLFAKIQQRFSVPLPHRLTGGVHREFIRRRAGIQRGCLRLLADWSEAYPADLRDLPGVSEWVSQLMRTWLRPAAASIHLQDPATPSGVDSLYLNRTAAPADVRLCDGLHPTTVPLSPRSPGRSSRPPLQDMDPEQFAACVGAFINEPYVLLSSRELLGQLHSDPSTQHLAPNLTELVRRSNVISQWVSHTFLSASSNGQRAKLVALVARGASRLKDAANFEGVFALLSGLDVATVRRIQSAFPDRVKRLLSEMRMFTDVATNFETYRMHIKGLSLDAAVQPAASVCLKDLFFAQEANPKHVDGRVNFRRGLLVWGIVHQYLRFQAGPVYEREGLMHCPQLHEFVVRPNDEEFWVMSYAIRRRGG